MPIFFTKKSCNRGGGTTPQMPLTDKKLILMWLQSLACQSKILCSAGYCKGQLCSVILFLIFFYFNFADLIMSFR